MTEKLSAAPAGWYIAGMDYDTLLDLAQRHEWVALAALVIGALVRVSKDDVSWFPIEIPTRWRPVASLVLGLSSGVLQAVATGTAWTDALVGGLVSGVLAIAGHDTLVRALRNGKDVPIPRSRRAESPRRHGSGPEPASPDEPDTLTDGPPPRPRA